MGEPIVVTITGLGVGATGGVLVLGIKWLLDRRTNGTTKMVNKCEYHDGLEKKIDRLGEKFDVGMSNLHEKVNTVGLSVARIEGGLDAKERKVLKQGAT